MPRDSLVRTQQTVKCHNPRLLRDHRDVFEIERKVCHLDLELLWFLLARFRRRLLLLRLRSFLFLLALVLLLPLLLLGGHSIIRFGISSSFFLFLLFLALVVRAAVDGVKNIGT